MYALFYYYLPSRLVQSGSLSNTQCTTLLGLRQINFLCMCVLTVLAKVLTNDDDKLKPRYVNRASSFSAISLFLALLPDLLCFQLLGACSIDKQSR